MAVNPIKIVLFLLGGSAAAGATAYVSGALDPYINGNGVGIPAAVAALPEPAPADPAAPKDDRVGEQLPPNTMAAVPPPEDTTIPPATMAPQPPTGAAATPPASGPQPPTFDIVRVEADGSLVIAGKAMADALVELLYGEKVLGSTKATAEGDFAIVLDEPLKPGDYQLTLRATPAGGTAVASLETAILSIPDEPGGQVLAMVEQPGEATEILTAPEVPAEVASAPPADAPKTEAAAPAEVQKPAEVAVAPADANPPAEPAPAPVEAKVSVEAVEIEGRKIFVAGTGEPGRFVRAYANEIVLGETKVGEGGRFLVEAERDLPVGDYIIRADLLDADGIKVIARAAVPFEREPGESIAAVAPGVEQPPEAPAQVAAAEPEQPTPPAGAETPPSGAAPQPEQPAVAAGEPPPADGSAPPADAAAAQPPATTEPAETPPVVAATEPEQPPAAGTPPAEAAAEPPSTDIAAAPPETVSPKLQKVQGAVIIRRGDTLWRISRRVYGKGVRYSTLYLANQRQISDPDRIWPGQVFSVPDKSKEGEAADMSAMGGQITTTTTTATTE